MNPYAGAGSAHALFSNIDEHDTSAFELSADVAANRAELFSSYLRELFSHKRLALASILLSLVNAISGLLIPIYIGQAIDCVLGAGRVDFVALTPKLEALVVATLISATSGYVLARVVARLANEVALELRLKALHKLAALKMSVLDSHPHGDLLSRISLDCDALSDGFTQLTSQLVVGVTTLLGTLFFMLKISPTIALVVLLLTPLSILVSWKITNTAAKNFDKQQALQGSLSAQMEEALTQHSLIKAYHREGTLAAKLHELNSKFFEVGRRAQFVSSLANPSTRLVNNIIYAIVAALGFYSVISSTLAITVGDVQVLLSYANQFMRPINELSALASQLQESISSYGRVLALAHTQEVESDAPDARQLDAVEGLIDFTDVHFAYEKDEPVIRDASLQVFPGHRVALVGASGCGKTTLLSLLMRFYEHDEGEISLDSTSIQAIERDSLRSHIGMVLQESWLGSGTLRDILCFGAPEASDDEILAMAKRCHIDGLIERLDAGLDTVLDSGSNKLSAGEKQLICICRVMLANPKILVLDEATSNIDTRTELLIQDALSELMEGRSSLVVAHRLSTIRSADYIYVMDAGEIIEQGTHEDLMAQNSHYAYLYAHQEVASLDDR